MAGPAVAPPAPRWSAGTWLEGSLVAGWLVGCDAWVKITARVAACPSTPTVGEAAGALWTVPEGCTGADFLGIARLSPIVRNGGPLGLGAGLLDGGAGLAWAIALLVLAAVVSVLVVRWRWRTRGDAAALGAVWGAAIVLAVPRLRGGGTGLAELQFLGDGPGQGLATGLGDLALVWAIVWLGWRAIAEARA